MLDTSRQVDITNNSIHGNGSLGIQVDDSAQDGLAAPTISSVAYTTGGQTVTGSFTALATTKYDVTIYTNSTATAGQGQTQITTVTVTTDSTGAGTFTYLLLDSGRRSIRHRHRDERFARRHLGVLERLPAA